MSNTIILKGGTGVPKNGDLKYRELGFADEDSGLYIGTNKVDENNQTVVKKMNQSTALDQIFDLLYPVGSVYFTVDENFNPNETDGWTGTWEDVSGCYLYLGNESIGEKTGNELNPISIEDHNLLESNLPSHVHGLSRVTTAAESAGTPSGSVKTSGSVDSHSHSYSGLISGGSHTHQGYYRADINSSSGSAQVLCTTNNIHLVGSTSGYVTSDTGSHSHSYSGTTDTTSPSLDISSTFSGSQLSPHSHTISGNTDSTGNGTPIEHNIELDLPKFTALAWRRIA